MATKMKTSIEKWPQSDKTTSSFVNIPPGHLCLLKQFCLQTVRGEVASSFSLRFDQAQIQTDNTFLWYQLPKQLQTLRQENPQSE